MISMAAKNLLIASKIKGIGRKKLTALSDDAAFTSSGTSNLRKTLASLRPSGIDQREIDEAFLKSERDIAAADVAGDSIICLNDKQYPELLKQTIDPPPILFVRGNLQNFSEKAIAVIGTREPSKSGLLTAERITRHFARKGWSIVSGLANGIDACAHEAALSERATTVAVFATGLNKVYPRTNKELAQRIVDSGGLLISEYSYETNIFKSNFVERDRIQAGLAKGVFMIQSDEVGGSLHASRAALNYGRILAVPKPIKTDEINSFPKIKANQIIHASDSGACERLLKTNSAALRNIFRLASKNDYDTLEDLLLRQNPEEIKPGNTESLI